MPLFRTWILLRLALKNIRLNWRHSFATMLAILFGFTAVSLFDGFLKGLSAFIEESYIRKGMSGHVIAERRGTKDHFGEDPWLYSLSAEEQSTLQSWFAQDPRVVGTHRLLAVTGLLSSGKSNALFIGVGLEEDKGLIFRGKKWAWNVIAGKPLYLAPGEKILLGRGIAKKMDCHYDESQQATNSDGTYIPQERSFACDNPHFQLSATTESTQVNALTLEAVGIEDFQIREYNDRIIAMPLDVAQKLLNTSRVSRIQILLDDNSSIPGFIHDMNEKAKQAGLAIEFEKWIDHPIADASRGGLEILRVFRALFLSIVAVIVAMAIANSMMKSVNERVREIGALRSFGFRQRDISLLFSFEGVLLSVCSCVAGMGLSLVLVIFVQHLGLSFNSGISSTPVPVRLLVAWLPWLYSSAVLSLIAFSSAWIVAFRASRMNVADALRYVA